IRAPSGTSFTTSSRLAYSFCFIALLSFRLPRQSGTLGGLHAASLRLHSRRAISSLLFRSNRVPAEHANLLRRLRPFPGERSGGPQHVLPHARLRRDASENSRFQNARETESAACAAKRSFRSRRLKARLPSLALLPRARANHRCRLAG